MIASRSTTSGFEIDCNNASNRTIGVTHLLTYNADKDVHKAPQLELVAWFTLTAPSGPQTNVIPFHQQLLENYNESILLLAFHTSSLVDGSTTGGKLPITVYETAFEAGTDGNDRHMQESGEGPQLVLRFRELPYTIETGEAEMIGVDFVAKGAGNAAATNGVTVPSEPSGMLKSNANGKGKAVVRQEDDTKADADLLSAEDEELIASLITKANAIRMLQQRISLMLAYINSIPSCYLNTTPSSTEPALITPNPHISHPILRLISATLARLPLLTPPTSEVGEAPIPRHSSSFAQESAQQKSDVALVSLLGSLGTTLRAAQDLGKKGGVVERARFQASQTQGGFGNRSKMPLRSGIGDDYTGFGGMAAYTPPTDFDAGDEGYVDELDGGDYGNENSSMSHERSGVLEEVASGGALRGKGKGVLRSDQRRRDEDEEMT